MDAQKADIHDLAFVDDTVSLGEGTVVRQFASVTGGTILGKNCSVAPFCMLHGPVAGDNCRFAGGVMMGNGFRLGNNVFVGPGVVLANDAWPRAHKGGWSADEFSRTPDGDRWAVVVEDGASIGANAVIMAGVRIGEGAMIAAGSVVFHDVPARHLYLGRDDIRPCPEDRERVRFAACPKTL